MKKFMNYVKRFFLRNYKYKQIEDLAFINLQNKFLKYQTSENIIERELLLTICIELVNYSDAIGLNGRTEIIKKEIKKE